MLAAALRAYKRISRTGHNTGKEAVRIAAGPGDPVGDVADRPDAAYWGEVGRPDAGGGSGARSSYFAACDFQSRNTSMSTPSG